MVCRNGCGKRVSAFFAGREVDVEGAAVARLGVDGNTAIVVLDDRVADGEPEPRALCRAELLRREVGIEDLREVIRGYADALVPDGDAQVATFGNGKPVPGLDAHVLGVDMHRAAIRHRLDRVLHDVADHLPYLVLIHVNGHKTGCHVQRVGNAGVAQRVCHRLTEEPWRQVDPPGRKTTVRKGNQLARQRTGE